MDDALRNSLWSFFYEIIACSSKLQNYVKPDSDYSYLIRSLWLNFFKLPIDSLPEMWKLANDYLKSVFLEAEWFAVYNFVEFVVKELPDNPSKKSLITQWNSALKKEVSAYRIVGSEVVRVTSNVEIAEIETAIRSSDFKSSAIHLQRALALLADRQAPDYRNSIKESISAVEAVCVAISGEDKSTLGNALKKLENVVNTHPALNKAFQALYGYTSDADGIRHALLEEDKLDFEDAKFMLVACTAFVNYSQEKARKAGIE